MNMAWSMCLINLGLKLFSIFMLLRPTRTNWRLKAHQKFGEIKWIHNKMHVRSFVTSSSPELPDCSISVQTATNTTNGALLDIKSIQNPSEAVDFLDAKLHSRKRGQNDRLLELVICLMALSNQAGMFDRSEAYFDFLKTLGVSPNECVYSLLLQSYQQTNRIDRMHMIIRDMVMSGVPMTISSCESVLEILIKNGLVQAANSLFGRLYEIEPQLSWLRVRQDWIMSLSIYTSVTDGFNPAASKSVTANEKSSTSMQHCKLTHPQHIFRILELFITAYCEASDLQSALFNVKSMRAFGLEPSLQSWTNLVKLFGATGCANELEKLWEHLSASHLLPDTFCLAYTIAVSQCRPSLDKLNEVQSKLKKHCGALSNSAHWNLILMHARLEAGDSAGAMGLWNALRHDQLQASGLPYMASCQTGIATSVFLDICLHKIQKEDANPLQMAQLVYETLENLINQGHNIDRLVWFKLRFILTISQDLDLYLRLLGNAMKRHKWEDGTVAAVKRPNMYQMLMDAFVDRKWTDTRYDPFVQYDLEAAFNTLNHPRHLNRMHRLYTILNENFRPLKGKALALLVRIRKKLRGHGIQARKTISDERAFNDAHRAASP